RQLQTETATPSRPRFVIEEVTTGSVLLCAIRREVAQISNAFDKCDSAGGKRVPAIAIRCRHCV
ncbi:hypothetical protein, partial [Burkholderia pseudomallei]|uniref:hypothetical protein n=1 Tax=Burkholderia pseudomallei TaxID=28450 RepID=UPI001C72096A